MIGDELDAAAAKRFRLQLKRHMVTHGVTQRMLARAMRVTEKHMSQVMTGRIKLTFLLAEQMAEHLGLVVNVRLSRPAGPDEDALFVDVRGGVVTLTHTTGRPLHVYVNGEYAKVPDRLRTVFGRAS